MKPYRHQVPQICDNHHSFISIRMNDTHLKFNVGIDCIFENICLKHRANLSQKLQNQHKIGVSHYMKKDENTDVKT